MVQVFGPGGVLSFVKFEKQVHPIIDSLLDQVAINFFGCLVEGIRIRHIRESIVFHLVGHTPLIQLVADVVMAVEIEFTREGEIIRLARVEGQENLVLCVDEDSGLVNDDKAAGEPFLTRTARSLNP
jgi:hypothetical protein